MKSILVPTDFSLESHHAYAVALQIAQQTHGTVTVLHVLEPLPMPPAGFSGMSGMMSGVDIPVAPNGMGLPTINELMNDAKHRLLELKQESTGLAPSVWVQCLVEVGRVSEGILAAVQQLGIDLVVMGAQGHNALEGIFIGSNTERLIRQAPCPVLTVKHAQARFEVHNIVFASDFAEKSATAADGFHHIAAAFPKAMVHLLYIRTDDDDEPAAAHYIEEFAEHAQLANYTIVMASASSPAVGIEQFAKQVKADLVVIPTHARSGLSRFFHPSVAEAVAIHALPPVLTYHV